MSDKQDVDEATPIVDGKTAWEFACGWYSTSGVLGSLNRRVDPVEVPKDQGSPEFAEFLCENSRHAMRKGIELGWRAAMIESKADTCAEELLPITSDWIKAQGAYWVDKTREWGIGQGRLMLRYQPDVSHVTLLSHGCGTGIHLQSETRGDLLRLCKSLHVPFGEQT